MATVRFTQILQRFYPDLDTISLPGDSAKAIVDGLNEHYPKLKSYIVDEQGQLRKHVNIFVNGSMVQDREGLSDKVSENDEVYIIQALSGG